MGQLKSNYIVLTLLICLEGCHAQPAKPGQELSLNTSITLTGIKGRIDHLAFDSASQQLFIAALGNNSIEVVDLKTNKLIHSIQGLNEPQGIAFIPVENIVFVANGGNGACDVFNTKTYLKITSVQLPGDADNVRYDPLQHKVYVGYGEGGIAIIDVATLKQVGDIELQGHPESFQLDTQAKRLYVNVPDKQQIEVIDLDKQSVIDRWKLTTAKSNFPMALDASGHRLFIGCRHPAKLLIIDSDSGKQLDEIDTDSDADDIFYNQRENSIYMSCGGGYVDLFKRKDTDKFTLSDKTATRSKARTSLFISQNNCLIVASPKDFNRSAELLIYGVKK
jgi:DNA-binding beta-propeller fold protein YncE